MGQKNWAGACALVVALAAMTPSPVARGQEQGVGGQEWNPFAGDGGPEGEAGHGPAYAARRIEWILDQPLKSPLQYPETPLNTVTGIISDEYELPIVFDTKALDAIAASPEAQVTVDLQNITLRSALDLMLAQLEDLTYIIDREVLMITTEDEANMRLEVRVYRVDDLLREGGAANSSEIDDDQLDELLDIVTSTVENDSWMENGTGEGEIQSFRPGMFVVSQTHRVHEQVVKLLAEMRRVKSEIEEARTGESTAQQPVTRGFRVLPKEFTEAESSRQSLRNAILRGVKWDVSGTELGDEDVFLEVLPSHVLVRHLPSVVRDVERVLRKCGATTDDDTGPMGNGFRAGGGTGGDGSGGKDGGGGGYGRGGGGGGRGGF